MTQELEALNADAHRDLRLRRWRGPRPRLVQIVASEFAAAAAEWPIVIAKSADTGRFYAGALFGFAPGEDLAAADGGAFVPLDLVRHGFYIAGDDIAVDPANPVFSRSEGEPLFEPDGEPSDTLNRVRRALGGLKRGVEETDRFLAAMLADKLVEPIDITLSFDDGERLRLGDLYTISLDAIAELDDAAVLRLFRAGDLQLAYALVASLRQIGVLAKRRNDRLAAA